MTRIGTVGHGTAEQQVFVSLLREAGVAAVVDVRHYPGSRANPHMARERMQQWLPEAGIDYRHDVRLGGRRGSGSLADDPWWRVGAFRGYAAHMRTTEFADGIADLLTQAARQCTVIMCAETVWWRCHRRMIADYLTLVDGADVVHLMHDGRWQQHPVAAGARREDGLLYYDLPREQ